MLALHECPVCPSDLMYPVTWRDEGDEWLIERRCPDCEFWTEGHHPHWLVEDFDFVLNHGTDQVIDLAERLTYQNMSEEIERFCYALRQDHILPMDF